MKSIRTLANVTTHTPFDIVDYPACKLFFPVNEGVGNTLTDLVKGVIVDYQVGFATGGPNTLAWSENNVTMGTAIGRSGVAVNSSLMPAISNTKDFMLIVVCDLGSGTLDTYNIGGIVIDEPQISIASVLASFNIVNDGVGSGDDAFSLPAIDSNTKAAALYSDRNDTKFYLTETDGATIASLDNIPINNSPGTIDLRTPAQTGFAMGQGQILFGAALFEFDKIPPQKEIHAAMSWMNVEWRKGNKILYPPWKNRT